MCACVSTGVRVSARARVRVAMLPSRRQHSALYSGGVAKRRRVPYVSADRSLQSTRITLPLQDDIDQDEAARKEERKRKLIESLRRNAEASSTLRSNKDTQDDHGSRTRDNCPRKSHSLRTRQTQDICTTYNYEPPRTIGAVKEQFEDLPWRIGRSVQDARTLVAGIPRLTELCLDGVRDRVSKGRLGDLEGFPDDLAIKVLRDASETMLRRVEDDYPSRIMVIDACWARLSGATELPQDVPRWRTLVERTRQKQQEDLEAASERLRMRYRNGEQQTNARTTMAAGPRDARLSTRRRIVRSGGGASTPTRLVGSTAGLSTLDRLRINVRRDRAQGIVYRRGTGLRRASRPPGR